MLNNIPGMILYEGESLFTGEPIVVIAVVDENPKTGKMLFTYILNATERPSMAAYTGGDVPICGDCKFRAQLDAPIVNGLPPRMCYVRLSDKDLGDHKAADERWSPDQIWDEWRNNGFLDAWDVRQDRPQDAKLLDDWDQADGGGVRYMGKEAVRVGSYGDPAACPTEVWSSLLECVVKWTGYSHAWDNPDVDPLLIRYCMASVNGMEEWKQAVEKGWRPFMVLSKEKMEFWESTVTTDRAILCPATAGKTTSKGEAISCANCFLCKGRSSNCLKGIYEKIHGPQQELHTWTVDENQR